MGIKRIAALKQLRRDTVNALVWEMSEAEALLLAHSLRMNSEPETALEQGWLLAEMEEKLGYTIEELARRFDRSATWVARRLALGGDTAGSGAAASPRRAHRCADRDEVSGAGGARQHGTVCRGWRMYSRNIPGPRGKPRCSTTPGARQEPSRCASGFSPSRSCF